MPGNEPQRGPSDLDAESLLREWLDDPSPEGQALHDSFVGLTERANLTLDAQLSAARLQVAELLRAQGRNWLRNSHFVEAAKTLREALQYAPASLEDKLVLVRALLPQSQRPDDEIGKETAALHSDVCCETGTPDWIDLQVSIG